MNKLTKKERLNKNLLTREPNKREIIPEIRFSPIVFTSGADIVGCP